jgi:hypothetical protein
VWSRSRCRAAWCTSRPMFAPSRPRGKDPRLLPRLSGSCLPRFPGGGARCHPHHPRRRLLGGRTGAAAHGGGRGRAASQARSREPGAGRQGPAGRSGGGASVGRRRVNAAMVNASRSCSGVRGSAARSARDSPTSSAWTSAARGTSSASSARKTALPSRPGPKDRTSTHPFPEGAGGERGGCDDVLFPGWGASGAPLPRPDPRGKLGRKLS